jgi:trimethylamine--corrinoid protein Co-methyltransferase
MNSGIKTQAVPSFRLLTEEQIQEIHRASLEVLESVGLRFHHEEAVARLAGAGCRVKNGDVVLFPGWLVEETIRSAPSRITIFARNGTEAMRLEGRNVYFGLGTDLIATVDLETGEKRPSVRQDVANAARIADYCDEIDFVASYALPGDVPTNLVYFENVRAELENGTKPIFFTAAGREDLALIIEMAEAVAGGAEQLRQKPFLIHYSEPTPPLTHSYGAINKLLLCAEKGLPITYAPAAIHGGSAPVTLAGGLVQANAEALSGLVLHQLTAKGAPLITGMGLPIMDMRTFCISYSAPELRLTNSALADLFHYYGIPVWSTVGSDAHILDTQASLEHGISTLLAALDGANLVHDVAYLGQGLLGDPAAILMCNEIISYVKRLLRGFDLNRENLAVDVIREVGPGGNYLTAKHTLNHFRQVLWRPHHLNRDNPETWEEKGALRYEERLAQKARDVLRTYEPEPLREDVAEQIRSIAKRAEQELTGLQFTA